MSSPDEDLSALEQRRAAVQAQLEARKQTEEAAAPGRASALGAALSLSVEFVAAAVVGVALGYGAGLIFGGMVWFILAGLVLGFATGVRNVIRAAVKMQAAASAPQGQAPQARDNGDKTNGE